MDNCVVQSENALMFTQPKDTQNINGRPGNSLIYQPKSQNTDKKLKVYRNSHKIGLFGLENLGNTCYINAALQALSHCTHLRNYLITSHDKGLFKTCGLAKCFSHILALNWTECNCPTGNILSHKTNFSSIIPYDFMQEMQDTYPNFKSFGQQEDAQEFLRYFLDKMHEELKQSLYEQEIFKESRGHVFHNIRNLICGNVWFKNDPKLFSLKNSDKMFNSISIDVGKDDAYYSIITELFNGRLLNSVKCLSCKYVSRTIEPFEDLSLPIPTQSSINVQKYNNDQKKLATWKLVDENKTANKKLVNAKLNLTNRKKKNNCNDVNYKKDVVQSHPTPSDNNFLILRFLISLNGISLLIQLFNIAKKFLNFYIGYYFIIVYSWFQSYTSESKISLENCFEAFFSIDELKDNNKYYCEYCKKLSNGIKYTHIVQKPEILCIHLKRFRNYQMFPSKISNHVEFPLRNLSLSKYKSKELRIALDNQTYDLVSVICHLGHYSSGHYITYAYNRELRKWFQFDDNQVFEVPERKVSNCEAYILFYQKKAKIARQQNANDQKTTVD